MSTGLLTIANLAIALIADYKKNDPNATLPDQKDIEKVLLTIKNSGELTDADLNSTALPATLKKIGDIVKIWNPKFGLPPVATILIELVAAVTSHDPQKFGLPRRPALKDHPAFDPQQIDLAKKTFWYWADENSLPPVTDGANGLTGVAASLDALVAAWRSWMAVLDIRVDDKFADYQATKTLMAISGDSVDKIEAMRKRKYEESHLIVMKSNTLRGPLALTSVGPGGSTAFGLEMRVDSNKTDWTYEELRGVLAHEIGHLLGLDDDQNNGKRLMSGTRYPNETPNSPTPVDIAEATALKWKKKT